MTDEEREEERMKRFKKLSSRKFFCVCWAMFMGFGFLVLTGIAMFMKVEIPSWFGVTVPAIFTLVGEYILVNGWQKTTEIKNQVEGEK